MVGLSALFGDDAEVLRETDFQLLLLVNLLPPLGTSLMSPVLESLTGPFGVSAAEVGLLVSLFTAPAIVLIPIAGGLSDRYGRKPLLVGGLVLFGGAGTAIAFTTDFRVALGLRVLQGVGFAALTPIIITSIGDLYDDTKEATAQGLRFTGSGLTNVVFPLFAGALVTVAWQYPFLLYAMAFPIAAVVALRFTEPTDAGRASEAALADGRGAQSQLRTLLDLLRHRRVLGLIVARTLPNVVWIGFLTYNSIIVVQLLDGTPIQAGILVAVGSLVFALTASQAGRATALLESRLSLLVAGHLALAVGLVVVFFAPSVPVAGAGIVLAGVGFGFTLALYRSIITGLAPQAVRGGLVSLAEAGGRVTVTATPILMGVIIERTAPALGFAGAIRLAGAGVALVAGVGGVLCLLAASTAPAVQFDDGA